MFGYHVRAARRARQIEQIGGHTRRGQVSTKYPT